MFGYGYSLRYCAALRDRGRRERKQAADLTFEVSTAERNNKQTAGAFAMARYSNFSYFTNV
jgi:hypothetical protein